MWYISEKEWDKSLFFSKRFSSRKTVRFQLLEKVLFEFLFVDEYIYICFTLFFQILPKYYFFHDIELFINFRLQRVELNKNGSIY